MKRAVLTLFVVMLVSASVGCHHRSFLRKNCDNCAGPAYKSHRHPGCRSCGHGKVGAGIGSGSMCRPGMLCWQKGGTDHIPRLPRGYYGHHVGFQGEPGPPTPTYTYPYYTTRAPRDFLMKNPPSIGR